MNRETSETEPTSRNRSNYIWEFYRGKKWHFTPMEKRYKINTWFW